MHPIETEYKGYLFRSRLEARWAVFFDVLQLEWHYEPQGFELPDGTKYLPDFQVQTPYEYTFWYEIKPASVRQDSKFSKFGEEINDLTGPPPPSDFAVLLSGDPRSVIFEDNTAVCPRCGGLDVYCKEPAPRDLYCGPCDCHTPSQEEWQNGALVGCQFHKGMVLVEKHNGPDNRNEYNSLITEAVNKARSARFEHGESPDV